jgi:hypothetical protein
MHTPQHHSLHTAPNATPHPGQDTTATAAGLASSAASDVLEQQQQEAKQAKQRQNWCAG